MATKVVMEALSPTMEEGRLVEWKKSEGEKVSQGDVLAEVETDKAVMDLVARADGMLLKQAVAAGATVPVGQLVGVIGDKGEDVSALVGGNGGAPKASAQARADTETPEAETTKPAADTTDRKTSMPPAPPASAASESSRPGAAPAQTAPGAPPAPRGEGDRVKASPLARKIAAERGLDLSAVSGSGPNGRIIQRDLEGLSAQPQRAAQPAAQAPAFQPVAPGERYRDVPLTQIRKTIAKRLSQSIGPVPTFYLTTEIDMTRAWEAREALKALDGPKVSFNDIIIKATALALKQHPACNAWWQDDHIRYWAEINISMAVAIEDGLITPVIRYADQKSLRQIAEESRDLAARARDRRLQPDEYTGGTFSISNLGMMDIDQFTAIINPPEAGILAIGQIAEKPVVVDGQIEPRRRLRVTMSCDHRVIDGATGAKFLQTLKAMLENPMVMVW